jgi:hypothetical protein
MTRERARRLIAAMKRAIDTNKTLEGRPFDFGMEGAEARPGHVIIALAFDGHSPPKVIGAPPLTGNPKVCKKLHQCIAAVCAAEKGAALPSALAIADGGDCEDALDRVRVVGLGSTETPPPPCAP